MTLKPCPRCARPIDHLSARCPVCGWSREVVAARPRAPEIDVAPAAAVPGPAEAPFLFVPTARYKLVLLSLTSLGFYPLVWIYRSWARIKERGGADVSPFWRTVFAPLFLFELFGRVADEAKRGGAPPAWNSTTLAAGFMALSIASRLPDPWWLVAFLNVVTMVPVLGTVNALNDRRRQPEDPNSRLSGANWVVIVLGGLVFWLAIVGAGIPDS